MKKIIGVAAFAVVGMIALSSCKKDYTCECVVTILGQTATSSTVLENVKKKDAESACDSGDLAGYSECEIL